MSRRCTATGCKNNNRCTSGDHARNGRNVISRRIHNECAFLSGPSRFLKDLGYRTCSTLVNTAETFFFDRRQASDFVAGCRMTGATILSGKRKMLFVVFADANNLIVNFRCFAALRKNVLGTDKFHGFAHHRRAA